MMLTMSPKLLTYLKMEWKWIRTGRPEEITDRLEDVWYDMDSEDMRFCSSRGIFNEPILTWENGNGFQFQMLDEMEKQLSAPVPQG